MKDSFGQYTPGEAPERGDDSDTAEYQDRGARGHRGRPPARGGRGYWIEPQRDEPVAGGDDRRGARPASYRAAERAKSRHGRRMLFFMGLSLLIMGALVIVGARVLAGETVVPGLSGKLFPVHYQTEIAQAAEKYGQDPYLIAAMVKTESGYDAEAESPAGAVGLLQLMPGTAEEVAAKLHLWSDGSGPVLTLPSDNLELGVYYLDYLGGIYGDGSAMTLAAYNAGLGHVDEWIEAAGGPGSFEASDIPFPETRDYVERVERYRQLYVRVHPEAFPQTSK